MSGLPSEADFAATIERLAEATPAPPTEPAAAAPAPATTETPAPTEGAPSTPAGETPPAADPAQEVELLKRQVATLRGQIDNASRQAAERAAAQARQEALAEAERQRTLSVEERERQTEQAIAAERTAVLPQLAELRATDPQRAAHLQAQYEERWRQAQAPIDQARKARADSQLSQERQLLEQQRAQLQQAAVAVNLPRLLDGYAPSIVYLAGERAGVPVDEAEVRALLKEPKMLEWAQQYVPYGTVGMNMLGEALVQHVALTAQAKARDRQAATAANRQNAALSGAHRTEGRPDGATPAPAPRRFADITDQMLIDKIEEIARR